MLDCCEPYFTYNITMKIFWLFGRSIVRKIAFCSMTRKHIYTFRELSLKKKTYVLSRKFADVYK